MAQIVAGPKKKKCGQGVLLFLIKHIIMKCMGMDV
jgi:hypothetical protein